MVGASSQDYAVRGRKLYVEYGTMSWWAAGHFICRLKPPVEGGVGEFIDARNSTVGSFSPGKIQGQERPSIHLLHARSKGEQNK
jgi:hypothetical protein